MVGQRNIGIFTHVAKLQCLPVCWINTGTGIYNIGKIKCNTVQHKDVPGVGIKVKEVQSTVPVLYAVPTRVYSLVRTY